MPEKRQLEMCIGTTFDYSIPLDAMCRMVSRAGFQAITLGAGDIAHSGYDTEAGRSRIRQIVAETRLRVDSVHAPFGKACDISHPDVKTMVDAAPAAPGAAGAGPEPATGDASVRPKSGPDVPAGQPGAEPATQAPGLISLAQRVKYLPAPERLAALEQVKNAIDAAQALGSGIVIVHPTVESVPEETRDRVLALKDSMKVLVAYARERNVRLAVENLPSLIAMQIFEAVLEDFPELGVCYDTSHARLSGDTFGVLKRFRDRIIVTHISDNRGKLDDHLLPHEGVIDWEEFSYYFAKVRQLGTFTLEVEVRESKFKDTDEFLRQAHARAGRLLAGAAGRGAKTRA